MWAVPGSLVVMCGMEMASTMLLDRAVCGGALHDSSKVSLSNGLSVFSAGSGCTVGRGAGVAGSGGVTAVCNTTATGDGSSDLLQPVNKISILVKTCEKVVKTYLVCAGQNGRP